MNKTPCEQCQKEATCEELCYFMDWVVNCRTGRRERLTKPCDSKILDKDYKAALEHAREIKEIYDGRILEASKDPSISPRNRAILILIREGFTARELSQVFVLSRSQVYRIINEDNANQDI